MNSSNTYPSASNAQAKFGMEEMELNAALTALKYCLKMAGEDFAFVH